MAIQDIGSNINRYMKIRKLTIPKLSVACELGTATISNIINGKSIPQSGTLLKISKALEVPLQKLLADAPNLKNFRFRTQKTLSAREKSEERELLVRSAQWLHDYKELEEAVQEHLPYKLKDDYSHLNTEEAAMRARVALGIGIDQPISDIVTLIEDAGVKIKISSFGFKQTFGLSVGKESEGPAIFVNSYPGITIERQIFTVAHELGHLLLHLDSYDASLGIESSIQEREADEFAGWFLMPRKAFNSAWETYRGASWIDSILRMKQLFQVSYLTVLHRLTLLNQSNSRSYLRTAFATEYQKKYHHDLKNHHEPDAIADSAFAQATHFPWLVRKALEEGTVSFSRAAEMMDISIESMREMVASWKIL